jgi:hypothetical protein
MTGPPDPPSQWQGGRPAPDAASGLYYGIVSDGSYVWDLNANPRDGEDVTY